MSNYKTMSSYQSYYKNLYDMYRSNSKFYMTNTDLGSGHALPDYKKPESIPIKVKKRLVKAGDKISTITSKSSLKDSKIMGRVLSP